MNNALQVTFRHMATSEPLQQLAKLPDRKDYDAKLTTIRYPAIDAARLHRDRLAELRIQKLCNSTAELIGHYLDETKVDDLKHEIAELRDLDARSK